MIWLALLGCPKPTSSPEARVKPPPEAIQRSPIAGPLHWVGPGGLSLDIPSGFRGTTGKAPLLLEISQDNTDFGLTLSAWPEDAPPPLIEGFYLVFEDEGRYRNIPLFGDSAATRTFMSEDPDGPTLQTWYALVDGHLIEVAIRCPIGRLTEGRTVLDPIVQGLHLER